MNSQRVIFLLLPDIEILDLAGPLQALYEANRYGAGYRILTCAPSGSIPTEQGISLAGLQPLAEEVYRDDLIIIPGMPLSSLKKIDRSVFEWLGRAKTLETNIYSICTGAFVLGEAGLLDGKQCTTHWTRIEDLKKRFPKSKVIQNRLFVKDGSITTSAGIAAGIDLTLSLIEQDYGSRLAAAVAREMVVYFRRNGSHEQESIYLCNRSHFHDGIHRVQDKITDQPEQRQKLSELAGIANMSERNLTRVFRRVTGISIGEYTLKLRLEMVKNLIADSRLSIDEIAVRCGFESSRQLRRSAKKQLGVSLSVFRKRAIDG